MLIIRHHSVDKEMMQENQIILRPNKTFNGLTKQKQMQHIGHLWGCFFFFFGGKTGDVILSSPNNNNIKHVNENARPNKPSFNNSIYGDVILSSPNDNF